MGKNMKLHICTHFVVILVGTGFTHFNYEGSARQVFNVAKMMNGGGQRTELVLYLFTINVVGPMLAN